MKAMKLKDFLLQFEGLDPELEVCVADWNEGYRVPHGGEAYAFVAEGPHVPEDFIGAYNDPHDVIGLPRGKFIQIGGG
jgi:hypothetical protein